MEEPCIKKGLRVHLHKEMTERFSVFQFFKSTALFIIENDLTKPLNNVFLPSDFLQSSLDGQYMVEVHRL